MSHDDLRPDISHRRHDNELLFLFLPGLHDVSQTQKVLGFNRYVPGQVFAAYTRRMEWARGARYFIDLWWHGRIKIYTDPQSLHLDKIGKARKPSAYTFWNDLFHPGVPDKFIAEVLRRISLSPKHFFIICTKRIERAAVFFQQIARWEGWWTHNGKPPEVYRETPFGQEGTGFMVGNDYSWPPENLMLMTTGETQDMADKRLPVLLNIPGVLHGVSYEPALSPVDFWQYLGGNRNPIGPAYGGKGLDWLIAGAETGPRARPSHPDCFRQARDQAVAAGVPFFLKSLGEWAPESFLTEEQKQTFWQKKNPQWGTLDREGNWFPETTPWNGRQGGDSPEGEYVMCRVGKKNASRVLDGRTWDEVPNVAT